MLPFSVRSVQIRESQSNFFAIYVFTKLNQIFLIVNLSFCWSRCCRPSVLFHTVVQLVDVQILLLIFVLLRWRSFKKIFALLTMLPAWFSCDSLSVFVFLTLKVWRKVFIFGTLLLKLSVGGRHQTNRAKKNFPRFVFGLEPESEESLRQLWVFVPGCFSESVCLFVCCEEKQKSDGRLTQNINVNLFSYADWNKGRDVHWHKTSLLLILFTFSVLFPVCNFICFSLFYLLLFHFCISSQRLPVSFLPQIKISF